MFTRSVKFEATKEGEQGRGWVAVDDIRVSTEDNCPTVPITAQVTTAYPETTTNAAGIYEEMWYVGL